MPASSPLVWLTLALASALLLGVYEVARKSAVEENAVLPVLLTANVGGLSLLLVSAATFQHFPELARGVRFSLEPVRPIEHLLIFLKSILVTSSWVCTFFAVKHLPISIAGPLRALSPLLTLLGALLIYREVPSTTQLLGMLVIFGGYLGFASLGRAEGIVFHADRWVLLLLFGTGLGAASGLYDKHLLQDFKIDPTTLQLWFTVDNVALQIVLTLVLWWPVRKQKPFSFRWVIPIVGCLLLCADQFYFRALAEPGAMVSVVSLLRRSSVLLSFVVGGLIFREQLLKKKAVFLVAILLGVLLLFFDSLHL